MMQRLGRGRRPPVVPHPGDLVIDGHVRARLLGLRLLELDAHIVVGNAPRASSGRPAPFDGAARAVRTGQPADPDTLPLAQAQRLLAEGSTVLAEARRMT
jgi:hypothetical protein